MNNSEFSFDKFPDIFGPKELITAKYPGSKNAVYSLFNRPDFPCLRHGKKLLVSKTAFLQYFRAAN
ncbi:MAG: hypothetical protein PHS04_11665 [Tissierellia bacterium]|nr:hypothetical protein [Tissierellia bacterium]